MCSWVCRAATASEFQLGAASAENSCWVWGVRGAECAWRISSKLAGCAISCCYSGFAFSSHQICPQLVKWRVSNAKWNMEVAARQGIEFKRKRWEADELGSETASQRDRERERLWDKDWEWQRTLLWLRAASFVQFVIQLNVQMFMICAADSNYGRALNLYGCCVYKSWLLHFNATYVCTWRPRETERESEREKENCTLVLACVCVSDCLSVRYLVSIANWKSIKASHKFCKRN